jgi:subtilase family serine protease
LYLSTDNVITTGDTLVATRSVARLAAGSSDTATWNVVLPNVPAGAYYLGTIADSGGAVAESDETNNASVPVAINITVAQLPDLVAVLSAPASGVAGSSIVVSDTVTNAGVGPTIGAFDVCLVLSTDNVIDAKSDTILVMRSAKTSLGPGEGDTLADQIVQLPLVNTGTYYLGTVADCSGSAIESDESNNASAPVPIAISGAPDIAVSGETVSPGIVPAGSVINFSFTVTNSGGTATGSFDVGVFISSKPSCVNTVNPAATANVPDLAAGASTDMSIPISTFAFTLQTWYVCAIVDAGSVVMESDESNNTSSLVSFQVQ